MQNLKAGLLLILHLTAGASSELPLYEVTTAQSWASVPSLGADVRLGDIRAVLKLTSSVGPAVGNSSIVRGQIWWRRRDPDPQLKAVVVTTESGALVTSSRVEASEYGCGVISLDTAEYPTETTFYAYWLY
jgi:hypothetical protein